jgi:hypothetical protein
MVGWLRQLLNISEVGSVLDAVELELTVGCVAQRGQQIAKTGLCGLPIEFWRGFEILRVVAVHQGVE